MNFEQSVLGELLKYTFFGLIWIFNMGGKVSFCLVIDAVFQWMP